MERIRGLREYVALPAYRQALGLPAEVSEKYKLLAQGEYNINYQFTKEDTGETFLLRVNCGSQMHLKHQIEYEAHALKLLEPSGRTPKVYYVDGSLEHLDHGVLVMKYLPGKALDYRKDLEKAALVLADIHSMPVPEEHGLIAPENPLRAILEECEEMVKTYMESPLGSAHTKERIRFLLDRGWEKLTACDAKSGETYHCLINTELNSTNFLVGEEGDYLIDWEKPLYGEPAQDLGHFLAPTTTFWKTDVILTPEEIRAFCDSYVEKVAGRFDTEGLWERVQAFIPITCLRGITWCAMAWVQYQDPDKLIVNESTMRKLSAYLSDDFLDSIEALG